MTTNLAAARALAPVFQADMPTTLSRLAALPDDTLSAAQRRVRDCVLARFGGAPARVVPADLPAAAAEILAAFQRYWTASLMHTLTSEEAEAQLSADLLPLAEPAALYLAPRAASVVRRLTAQGLFALGGVTPPLHELMLWRKQSSATQTVALPGGSVEIRVTLLDDFVTLGWVAWATCDGSRTGGWASRTGAVMVVVPAWNLASENYRVSLLAHESQHVSDYRHYPRLSAPDLEYRAKLVELALARQTQRALLIRFTAEAARNRALPHPFASWWLGERLRARLGADLTAGIPADDVRRAAEAELQAHSAALHAKGADSVETALPD